MSTELQRINDNANLAQISAEVAEQVIGQGDVSKLTSSQRVEYLAAICKTLRLNPLTQPIRIMALGGKTTMYATRDCTDQLRVNHGVSVTVVSREKIDDLLVVTVRATTPDGRTDEAVGAISVKNLSGESLANAMMKAETKAKRRVTLSICGLGLMDETEVESVQMANSVPAPSTVVAGMVPTLSKDKAEAKRQLTEMRARLGDQVWYEVLGGEGYEEITDVKSRPDLERVWGLMEMAANMTEAEVVNG